MKVLCLIIILACIVYVESSPMIFDKNGRIKKISIGGGSEDYNLRDKHEKPNKHDKPRKPGKNKPNNSPLDNYQKFRVWTRIALDNTFAKRARKIGKKEFKRIKIPGIGKVTWKKVSKVSRKDAKFTWIRVHILVKSKRNKRVYKCLYSVAFELKDCHKEKKFRFIKCNNNNGKDKPEDGGKIEHKIWIQSSHDQS